MLVSNETVPTTIFYNPQLRILLPLYLNFTFPLPTPTSLQSVFFITFLLLTRRLRLSCCFPPYSTVAILFFSNVTTFLCCFSIFVGPFHLFILFLSSFPCVTADNLLVFFLRCISVPSIIFSAQLLSFFVSSIIIFHTTPALKPFLSLRLFLFLRSRFLIFFTPSSLRNYHMKVFMKMFFLSSPS